MANRKRTVKFRPVYIPESLASDVRAIAARMTIERDRRVTMVEVLTHAVLALNGTNISANKDSNGPTDAQTT